MINKFDLEIRIVAFNLAKWLTLAQTERGSAADLRSVHVVGIDVTRRLFVPAESEPDGLLESGMQAVRQALQMNPKTTQVLVRQVEEQIGTATSLESNQ